MARTAEPEGWTSQSGEIALGVALFCPGRRVDSCRETGGDVFRIDDDPAAAAKPGSARG